MVSFVKDRPGVKFTAADDRFLKPARKASHEAKCERDLAAFRKKVEDGKAKPKNRKKG